MTVNKIEYNQDIEIVNFIKNELETNYCVFLLKDNKGNKFFQVHDGYVIFDNFAKNVWYIQSGWNKKTGKLDDMIDVTKYAERQWKRINLR